MEEKNQNLEENLDENLENEKSEVEEEKKSKSKFNPKILIFGLPLFVIQLIAVYFITANILLTKMESRAADKTTETHNTEAVEEDEANDTSNLNLGEYIFEIEDIIVNPAYTKGEQLLLSSVAFDVPSETIMKELEKKQILVKDAVISVLSSKSISQLGNVQFKDSLRVEISEKVHDLFSDIKVNKVYFSKYILN